MPPRYRLEFDPPGYQHVLEPGFDWSITGDEIAVRKDQAGKPYLQPYDNFWNPARSKWLATRPYHLEPDWYRNPLLTEQTVGPTQWHFASALSGQVHETNIANVVGGPVINTNKFMVITADGNLAGGIPLVADLPALFAAAGVPKPDGIEVVARTTWVAPEGVTPGIRRVLYPPPYDTWVFGFGNYALVFTQRDLILLEDLDGFGVNWRLVRSLVSPVHRGTGVVGYRREGQGVSDQGGMHVLVPEGQTMLQTLYTSFLGATQLYLGNTANMSWLDLVDKPATLSGQVRPALKAGDWWFTALPNQLLSIQVQVTRYKEAYHAVSNDPTDISAEYFNLGNEGYFPTMDPTLAFHGMVYHEAGETLTQTDLPVSGSPKVGYSLKSEVYGSELGVMLIDALNNPWVSNGLNGSGALYIRAIPGTAPSTGASAGRAWTRCYPTALLSVVVEIPPKLQDRVSDPRALYSDQWRLLRGEVFFRNPFSKKLSLEVDDDGLKAIEAMNLHRRHDFPVHLTEDTAGDGSYAALRGRWWVEDMNWDELKDVDGDPDMPFRRYEFVCRGLLFRLENSAWLYQADLVDASNNGHLEHTEAARKVFLGAGFPVTDPAQVVIEADPGPIDVRLLPGDMQAEGEEASTKQQAPYGPDWDEAKGSYLNRLALTWRGWLLVESRLTVFYASDPVDNLDDWQIVPDTVFRLYRNHASAAAAGKPDQHFQPSKSFLEALVSNFLRVIGVGADDAPLPHLILRDWDSVQGPIGSVFNFVGEWVRAVAIKPKAAISAKAQDQIGRAIFKKVRRDRIIHQFPVNLLPWELLREDGGAGADVGQAFEVEGHSPKLLVSHMEFRIFTDDQGLTDLSGEELPLLAALPPPP